MNELVSIVVPVFNSENTICRCLESIKKQSYKNIEVIIVNDGSTDLSENLVYEFCKEDNRFLIYNKKNEGVSIARNYGIKQANGKYIYFVDADDFLQENTIERLYNNIINNNSDILMCSYYEICGKKKREVKFDFIQNNSQEFYSNEITENIIPKMISRLKNEKETIMGSVWRTMIKTEIAKKNFFNPKLKIGEDLIFIIDCLLDCQKLNLINECLYNYVRYDDSTTLKFKKDFDEINKNYHIELLKRLNEISFFDNNKIRYQINLFVMYSLSISNIVRCKEKGMCEKRSEINTIVKRMKNNKYIDREILKQLDFKMKICYWLMECNLSGIILIIYTCKCNRNRRRND